MEILQESFSGAKNWVKELQQQVPSIVIALAGNKSDMVAKRMVDFEEAQAYADENGLLFMETSAKTAMNVNDIFRVIGGYSYTFPKLQETITVQTVETPSSISIDIYNPYKNLVPPKV